MSQVKIGIIGCGNISGIYLQNLTNYKPVAIAAVADLDVQRAKDAAGKYSIPIACDVETLLGNPEIDIVLDLTVPKAHYDVKMKALQASKHVYSEKPYTATREQGLAALSLAREKKLVTGGAPDTVLGAGIQTCRKLIDDGEIGDIVGANAFMLCHGHESWHPSPEFYYEIGGGPMFDMGPYYLTALVTLLGSVRRVSGSTRASFPTRTITSEPKKGKVVKVETPTHIVGVLDFNNGAIGQITTSFDVWHHHMPCIEVYGTKGSLLVPDPNGFGGPVKLRKQGDGDWQEVDLKFPYAENSRGVGVMDMAYAIRNGRPARASGELAFHVLDIMHAVHESSNENRSIILSSGIDRPAPMRVENPGDDLIG